MKKICLLSRRYYSIKDHGLQSSIKVATSILVSLISRRFRMLARCCGLLGREGIESGRNSRGLVNCVSRRPLPEAAYFAKLEKFRKKCSLTGVTVTAGSPLMPQHEQALA